MNRRNLLKAMPAALAVGAVPAFAAIAVQETPIAAMYREICRLRTIANDQGIDDAIGDAACGRMMELANAIADIPARDPEDMLRKIMGVTVNGDHDIGDGPNADAIWAEARALVA